jgi:hypothetical protein
MKLVFGSFLMYGHQWWRVYQLCIMMCMQTYERSENKKGRLLPITWALSRCCCFSCTHHTNIRYVSWLSSQAVCFTPKHAINVNIDKSRCNHQILNIRRNDSARQKTSSDSIPEAHFISCGCYIYRSDSSSWSEIVQTSGLANVAAKMINLHGFEAPTDCDSASQP